MFAMVPGDVNLMQAFARYADSFAHMHVNIMASALSELLLSTLSHNVLSNDAVRRTIHRLVCSYVSPLNICIDLQHAYPPLPPDPSHTACTTALRVHKEVAKNKP